MINLAPLKYARVLLKHNGPIETITYGRISIRGKPMYQANAYLSKHLNLERTVNQLYGHADGTGNHTSAMVARHMAISEAIERWALYYLHQSGHKEAYGLAIDPGSTGMSAFPGLFASQARRFAQLEAIERFCQVGWWNGDLGSTNLPQTNPEIHVIQLNNPLSRDCVVIVWRRSKQGFHTYGFAAARDRHKAIQKAVVEMERTCEALKQFHLKNPGFEIGDLETLENLFEKRALFFSLPRGFRMFKERIEAPAKPLSPIRRTLPLVDSKINGPWNRYATVWRTLYAMPTRDYLKGRYDFFFW